MEYVREKFRNNQVNVSGILIFLIVACMLGIFGALYGTVINALNPDINENVKKQFNIFFGIAIVLVAIIAGLSIYLIKSQPLMFQTYTLVMLHVSLAISLIGVSYGTLRGAMI
jgi:hypothetical protein